MPEMAIISSSSLSVTSVSIVPGEAPSRVVSIVIRGSSTLGKRSMGIRPMETNPSTINAPIIMTAITGRLMHKSAIHIQLVPNLDSCSVLDTKTIGTDNDLSLRFDTRNQFQASVFKFANLDFSPSR